MPHHESGHQPFAEPAAPTPLELAWYAGVAAPTVTHEFVAGRAARRRRGPLALTLVKLTLLLSAIGLAALAGRAISPPVILKTTGTTPSRLSARLSKPHLYLPPDAKWRGKSMSAWRRTYILEHGHQPPDR